MTWLWYSKTSSKIYKKRLKPIYAKSNLFNESYTNCKAIKINTPVIDNDNLKSKISYSSYE